LGRSSQCLDNDELGRAFLKRNTVWWVSVPAFSLDSTAGLSKGLVLARAVRVLSGGQKGKRKDHPLESIMPKGDWKINLN